MNSPRSQAVKILKMVLIDKQSLSSSMNTNSLNQSEQSWCKNLCFGVMREYFILEKILKSYLKKPLKTKDTDVYILLLLGVYQLLFLRTKDYAAINETVNQSIIIKKPWAKKLLNAILRSVQRDKNSIEYSIFDSHPPWLIDLIKQHYPKELTKILTLNQQQTAMSLRVNINKINPQTLIENLPVTANVQNKFAVILDTPIAINELPEFQQGLVSVQDAGFQNAAVLLDLKPDLTILDACAAPGGKTTHILEIEPTAKVTALDNKENRLHKITENLSRLKLSATIILGNATLKDWWDGKLFDRILCDVPCSGLGIIRRHPDIKYLRSPSDIQELLKTQMHILENCWSLLKNGGILLYSTCSILPDENEQQIAKFIRNHTNVKSLEITNVEGKQLTYGIQALPNNKPNHDGFYYAKLQKIL